MAPNLLGGEEDTFLIFLVGMFSSTENVIQMELLL